jgi:hypothetical protein
MGSVWPCELIENVPEFLNITKLDTSGFDLLIEMEGKLTGRTQKNSAVSKVIKNLFITYLFILYFNLFV